MTLTEVSMVFGLMALLFGGGLTILQGAQEARHASGGPTVVRERTEPARFGIHGWSTGGAVSTIPADVGGR